MDEPIQWRSPFNDDYGNGMVYRPFMLHGRFYAVGFEWMKSLGDFTHKGQHILKMSPIFQFPLRGVWGVIFDEIDPDAIDFKGFRHIQHPGVSGGRVLLKVACAISEHYAVTRTGAYVFSAATDPLHLRKTDLVEIYNRILGLEDHPQSRLFRTLFNGWQAFSTCENGGREYVVTTDGYRAPDYPD